MKNRAIREKNKKQKIKSPEENYVDAAIIHLRYLDIGDSRRSNAAHDRLIKAIRNIRNRPDRGLLFLSGLLTHDDENVRLWSASHLLPLNEEIAIHELKKLAKNANSWIVRSSAENTEAEWQKDNLDIDWFMKN